MYTYIYIHGFLGVAGLGHLRPPILAPSTLNQSIAISLREFDMNSWYATYATYLLIFEAIGYLGFP